MCLVIDTNDCNAVVCVSVRERSRKEMSHCQVQCGNGPMKQHRAANKLPHWTKYDAQNGIRKRNSWREKSMNSFCVVYRDLQQLYTTACDNLYKIDKSKNRRNAEHFDWHDDHDGDISSSRNTKMWNSSALALCVCVCVCVFSDWIEYWNCVTVVDDSYRIGVLYAVSI